MKRCPQCETVYSDDVVYCLNDGAPLIEENLPLPSAMDDSEDETIVRRKPLIVDVGKATAPVFVEQKTASRNYAIFLILGLLLGGSLVLATLFAARYIYKQDDRATEKTTVARNQNAVIVNDERETEEVKQAGELHRQKNESKADEDFNGRVIAVNAYVRSAPSRGASEIDVLPIDDRINIEKRENDESPWYYITCEHGTSGWMHGNTIEFTNGN